MVAQTALPQDFADLLGAFAEAEVRYLIVGGYALAFHGHPRFTKDIDVWLDPTVENTDRALAALRTWGAPSSVRRALAEANGLDVVWIGNPPIRIDLMKNVPGGDFERAWAEHVTGHWGEVVVEVVGRDELVRLKREAGRPQDLVDLSRLGDGEP